MEQEEGARLNNQIIKSFATARVFKDFKSEIISIDFSDDGNYLVACDDTMLNLYDCKQGKQITFLIRIFLCRKIKTLYQKLQQISHLKFTHNNQAVLCCTKTKNEILYWSIHENDIVKIFKGHTDKIRCLEMHPKKDLFLTTSKDFTLRLWDLKQEDPLCEAIFDLNSKKVTPLANYDGTGLVFIVIYCENMQEENKEQRFQLYSTEKYEQGPFANWIIKCPEVQVVKFNNDGKYILCSTAENQILIIDAFEYKLVRKFSDHENSNYLTIEASFSPDSQYVISGSENGEIIIWEIETGEKVAVYEAHVKSTKCVKFSPSHLLIASACQNLVFWLPKDIKEFI